MINNKECPANLMSLLILLLITFAKALFILVRITGVEPA